MHEPTLEGDCYGLCVFCIYLNQKRETCQFVFYMLFSYISFVETKGQIAYRGATLLSKIHSVQNLGQ